MRLVNDFYNKVKSELHEKYFPNVKYFRDDEKCQKMAYEIECFSNGCLGYSNLLKIVSRLVKVSKEEINNIIKKYVIDYTDLYLLELNTTEWNIISVLLGEEKSTTFIKDITKENKRWNNAIKSLKEKGIIEKDNETNLLKIIYKK